MIVDKTKDITSLSLKVTEGVSVNLITNLEHEFLMTTQEVAIGYGTTDYTIRQSLLRNKLEFQEGKHFLKGITKRYGLVNSQPHQMFWTKRGIVRLGFFIKSPMAKLFRDWAEDLIINKLNQASNNGFSMDYDLMLSKLSKLDKRKAIAIVKDMKYCEQQSQNFMNLHSQYKDQYFDAVGGLI